MNSHDVTQHLIYLGALACLAPLLGAYMARVFEGKRAFLHPVLGWLERIVYRLCGVNENVQMRWNQYAWALVCFNALGLVVVFGLQLVQKWLPLNPQGLANVPWDLALNTAVSFMTNTNWQSYAGETTLSYGTQMLALTVQNFVSAATGIAVLLALARGIAQKSSATIGNFWADLTRSVVYVLLPLAAILAIGLVSDGVVQTLSPALSVKTLEGGTQLIPVGPAASQVAIKQLGTNGGGFFNANSSHPLENPTPVSNFLQLMAILLIPAALVFTYGRLVAARKHAWIIAGVMLLLFVGGLVGSLVAESQSNPALGVPVNLEGKELRFGIANSVLWSVATTAASNGSVNSMLSSLSPLAGGIALFNIMLGEIVFGGVGAGLYGMLLHVLLTVFLAGLMVGRTPEYMGKKIEAREIQMVIIAILAPSAVILIGAGAACVLPAALAGLANPGPHGLSELLYAYSSAAGNNGSAFAGLNANSIFFNVTLALAMLIGRFVVIIPCLAIAGRLAAKKAVAKTGGTFETDNTLFAVLLIGTILIVGALTFFPALCLGPVAEHFLVGMGRAF